MRSKVKALSWTPKRNGAIYCAPACGRGCTHAEFLNAARAAKLMAEELGPDWEPHVWENLGWYYAAQHKAAEAKVYGSRSQLYWADFHFAGHQFHADGPTPAAAVEAVQKVLRSIVGAAQRAGFELRAGRTFARRA